VCLCVSVEMCVCVCVCVLSPSQDLQELSDAIEALRLIDEPADRHRHDECASRAIPLGSVPTALPLNPVRFSAPPMERRSSLALCYCALLQTCVEYQTFTLYLRPLRFISDLYLYALSQTFT